MRSVARRPIYVSLKRLARISGFLMCSRQGYFDQPRRIGNPCASHRTYPASQTFASWNQIGHVLRRLEAFRSAAGSAYGAIHISKGP